VGTSRRSVFTVQQFDGRQPHTVPRLQLHTDWQGNSERCEESVLPMKLADIPQLFCDTSRN
jgi:hypothetical protein